MTHPELPPNTPPPAPAHITVELEPWMRAIAEAAARQALDEDNRRGRMADLHHRVDRLDKRLWQLYAALAASGLFGGASGAAAAILIR